MTNAFRLHSIALATVLAASSFAVQAQQTVKIALAGPSPAFR